MTPLLEVHGVSKRFGGLRAVDDVSFAVGAGEIVGLIGPNGAGKSTLFSLVAGSHRPSSGTIRFGGRDVTGWQPHQAAAAGVGRTFQLMRVFTSMTVRANVVVAAHCRHRRAHSAEAAAGEVLDRLGMAHLADQPATTLTAAGKKRLELARALALSPALLLLDEVLSGLTPVETRQAVELIRDVNADGVAIVLVEHVMEVVMPLSQRVVVLDHGRQLAEGAPDAVAADPAVIDAYLGVR